jgi:hypothetical protein
MIARILPLPLLGLFLLISMPVVFAEPPTIQLIVPRYDYPQSNGTQGEGIANDGSIVGSYVPRNGTTRGFLRLLHTPFSPPLSAPDSIETEARGINNAGVVCGTFVTGGVMTRDHGFFFDGTTYTQYDVPGAVHTDITGENDAGDFTGFYYDGSSFIGFVNIGGVLTTFSVAPNIDTYPQAINNLGQIVGYFGSPYQGFFRDADGTLTFPINYPLSTSTEIYGLNDRGLIVGTFEAADLNLHGFVRTAGNHFIPYDYPDEQFNFTVFRGINNSGVINGFAQGEGNRGSLFGFIARFVR